jgi:hypothetical protein
MLLSLQSTVARMGMAALVNSACTEQLGEVEHIST